MMSYSVTRVNKKNCALTSPTKISRRKTSSPRKLLRRNVNAGGSGGDEDASTTDRSKKAGDESLTEIKTDDDDGAAARESVKREVFIMPESLLDVKNKENPPPCPDFVPLRHPKTGCKAVFMFAKDNSEICELLRYTDGLRSWFIGDSVEEDGSIVVSTPIDPLFLIIPYLQKTDKFTLLEQIVEDEEFPECSRLLSCPKLTERLTKILDSKEFGNETVYRLNQEKVLNWLKVKVEKLAALLKQKNYHVGGGAQLATFVRSKKDRTDDKDAYLSYAAGIISEYIPESLSKELLKFLSVDDVDESSPLDLGAPSEKRPRLSTHGEPTENYGDSGIKAELQKPTLKPKKLSTSQKALSKVDKTGMKSISSFFKKK